MAGSETLAFSIVGDAASAARAFKQTADSAALAARGSKMASDALDLQAKTTAVTTGATLALARADKVLADAEASLARDTAVANAVLGRQAAALLGSGTAGAVGSMLAAAASGQAPSGGGNGLAPGIAMAAAAMGIARKQTRLFSDSISAGTPVWDSARKGIFGLNGELQLFGGALASAGIPHVLSAATAVHLLSEGVIETAGTLVPAAVAFSAFGAAAVPSVMSVYTQMSNLHTIAQATGTQVPGLTGNFSKMAAAVQPQVYQLFGEALVFANHGTGQLQVLATGAGKVLDDLGARFVAATTGGRGFSAFIDKSTSDLAGWGNLIGNIGGIFGNVLKVLPGYAEQILSVLQGVSHGIEVVTGSPLGQWILGIGLAAHGALFYVGLLGTGLAVLASRGLAAVAGLALGAATKIEGLGAAGAVASRGLLGFGAAAEGAAALPWGWISVAAAGIAVLAYQLAQAKDQTQQFYASLQQLVQNSSLSSLSATIAAAQAASLVVVAQRTREAAAAEGAYTQSLKQGTSAAQIHAGFVTRQQSALQGAVQAQHEAVDGNRQLNDTYALVNSRVAELAKAYGGTSGALAALNAAGITSAQITNKSSSAWQQVQIELQATNSALREMNISTGALGSDYVNSLLPAVQKVTQAQDAQLNAIIGSQQGLVGWAQGLAQATKDAKAHGASLAGLNAQSLTLAGDYYGTLIPASQKLIDALEAQGASTRDLRTAVADQAAQLLPFTRNSAAAKSVLVDMVNNALGPGTVSMQNLSGWTGKNSGTMAGFKAIVDKATISAGNLAGTLGGLLNQQFEAELLKASGAAGATKAFADAVVKSGDNSQATRSARANLIADLEKSGFSARDATGYVDGLQRKIDSMHGKTVPVDVHGSGSGSISASWSIGGTTVAKQNGHLVFFASGGRVGGAGSGDTVPAMLTPGEVVVPKAMVAAGAVDHLRGSLPGFASGGLVGGNLTGFTASQEGQFASREGDSFGKAMLDAFNKAGTAAAKAAAAAAAAAGTGGSAATRWAPDILRVLAMLRQDSSNLAAVEHRISQESGGNPNAINLWDINAQRGDPSRGLMQVIGATFARYRSFALSGNIYDPLANIFAGVNYAIQAYAPRPLASVMLQAGGYDKGGYLPTGLSLAYNGTGRPEPVIPAQVIPRAGRGAGGGTVSRRLSADAQAIIAALEANTAAVLGQGRSVAHSLNSVSAAAASRGSYSTRR